MMKMIKSLIAMALIASAALVTPTAVQANNNQSPVVTSAGIVLLKVPIRALENRLTIRGPQGNIVLEDEGLIAGTNYELDLSGFPPGNYSLRFVFVNAQTGQVTVKTRDFIIS